MSADIQEVQSKINSYVEKLGSLQADDKRIKKRILQNLGKLKKKLEELQSSNVSSEVTSVENVDVKQFTPAQASMKLKLLNKELAQYAKKKQLNLCKKRFNWGRKRNLPLNVHSYANLLNTFVRCGKVSGKFITSTIFIRI